MDLSRHAAEQATPGVGRDRAGPPSPHRWRLVAAMTVIVLLAVVGAVAFTAARHRRESAERERLARVAAEGPRVLVATASLPAAAREVTLPGDVRAFLQATVYAKVNGYVREMRVDKGDRVRRGQVLATVEAPENDQQVLAARAALQVRRRNAARARALAPQGIVSRQELDQALSDLAVAEADYRRVQALRGYEVLRAPFDGVVTARYVDPGALTSATATGAPVVEVADASRARVLVYVGQDVAPFVRLGDPGEITLDEAPDARVPAAVRRIADALDPRSRSMLVELWPTGESPVRLVPGLFVHVRLRVAIRPLPVVPSDALVTRGDRTQVALVRDRRLHFVDVETGQGDGRTVQIRRGVQAGETVARSPPSDLGEGAPVQPVAPQPPRQGGQAGGREARAPPSR